MALSVPIDTRDITVTPVFRYVTRENVNESERAGHLVVETIEAVEIRFAGSKLYSPVVPVDSFWKREGHNVITYAERWPEQYRAFVKGGVQKAAGTPLEMLKSYGISDSQLSMCRVMKVYSIEALGALEGPNLKSLGMGANDLKRMAEAYLADRANNSASASEVAELRAEIERLRAALPMQEATEAEKEAAIQAADDEFAGMSDSDLKDEIAKFTEGKRPQGNPSRATLIQSLKELMAA